MHGGFGKACTLQLGVLAFKSVLFRGRGCSSFSQEHNERAMLPLLMVMVPALVVTLTVSRHSISASHFKGLTKLSNLL